MSSSAKIPAAHHHYERVKSMKSTFYKQGRAWIELDMNALRHNAEVLRALLPPDCELMPAVKADAYGHGAVLIAKALNRLGEPCGKVEGIRKLFQLENLRVDGIFTHLCADDTENAADRAFTLRQDKAFWNLAAQLRSRGCDIPKAHLLSSYGLLKYPGLGGDYARVGIALYGVLSTRDDQRRCGLGLRPVKPRISAVRALKRGEGAGYGLAFHAKWDSRIAALSIGYADGLPRALSCGVGGVLVNGCTAPFLGRVCMDQTLIDVTGIPDVHAGDAAVLIGTADGRTISAYDLAEETGTITNEVLSRLGPRLARVAVGQRQQIP